MRIWPLLISVMAVLPVAVHAADPAPLAAHTARSEVPLLPEQQAMRFDKAVLAFRVDPARKWLDGDARLTFGATAPLSALVVDLDPRYAVARVEVDGRALSPQAWGNPDGRLRVRLTRQVPEARSVTLRVVYAGSPHVAKRAPWDGGIVWSTAPGGEPWVATALQGLGCDLLWPCIDNSLREPGIVEQSITVPAPLVAAGNGVSLGMREHDGWRTWLWRARQPGTYAVALNIGPYEVLEADYRSRFGNVLPLRMWYLRGNRDKAKALFDELPAMLAFFEEVVGPYPWPEEKVGVVETPYLGMEHQTINAYGNGYKRDIHGYDWLMQHELAHEWFGNQMTHVDSDDFWLHEGFGMYMQPRYLQWLRGDANYFAEMLRLRGRIAALHPLVSGKPFGRRDPAADPGGDVYDKGAWLLHTLRGLVGEAAFRRATTELVYGRPNPKPGNFRPVFRGSDDFIAIVNRVSGRDLGWFFDVYLRSAALPRLDARRDGGMLRLRWITEGDRPFPMPVEVRVGERIVAVPMADGRGAVALGEGESFTLDPHSKVLRDAPEVTAWRAWEAAQREAASKK